MTEIIVDGSLCFRFSPEWQAIKYASYISSLSDEEIFQKYAVYEGCDISQAKKGIEEFKKTGSW